jgi:hypothetical protein
LYTRACCATTIQSSVADDTLDFRLAEVRELTEKFCAGKRDSHYAFRDLVYALLKATVMQSTQIVDLEKIPGGSTAYGITGLNGQPLALNDGRFLRMAVSVYLEETDQGRRLKVRDASYQYQNDSGGDEWVVRYDYLRFPKQPHPNSHLQINAALKHSACLPSHGMLERIHFPTHRISLEAVIRMLAHQFQVPCNEDESVWTRLLSESERLFLEIAHKSISGPEAEVE